MTLGAFLFVPFAGYLSDRFGAKRVAIVSTVLISIVSVSFALMTESPVHF